MHDVVSGGGGDYIELESEAGDLIKLREHQASTAVAAPPARWLGGAFYVYAYEDSNWYGRAEVASGTNHDLRQHRHHGGSGATGGSAGEIYIESEVGDQSPAGQEIVLLGYGAAST